MINVNEYIDFDEIMINIDENDKNKLFEWYNSVLRDYEVELIKIVSIFLWCLMRGRDIEEKQNNELLSQKSSLFKITEEELSRLFFKHYNFEIFDRIDTLR